MNKKMSRADWIVEICLQIIGIGVIVVTLYPIINMLAESLSSTGPVQRGEVSLLPKGFTLKAYEIVLTNEKVLRSLSNSVFMVIFDCTAKIFMVYLSAYPLALCDFPGKKVWSGIILVAMWVSAGMIPTFMVIKNLGLYNTYAGLVLVGLISPYNIMIARNFLNGQPRELLDSARVDGAKEIRIMLSIYAPLSKPLFATLAIWNITGTWNSYLEPTIYLSDSKKYLFQQVLRSIVLENQLSAYDMGELTGAGANNMEAQIGSAVLLIAMIPMICIYPFAQKHFVKGTTVGAVKG